MEQHWKDGRMAMLGSDRSLRLDLCAEYRRCSSKRAINDKLKLLSLSYLCTISFANNNSVIDFTAARC